MLPQQLTTSASGGNGNRSRFLFAGDDTVHSAQALDYVGRFLRDARDMRVALFHVLKPMPRELLGHGGSEDPAEEVRLAEEVHPDQANGSARKV